MGTVTEAGLREALDASPTTAGQYRYLTVNYHRDRTVRHKVGAIGCKCLTLVAGSKEDGDTEACVQKYILHLLDHHVKVRPVGWPGLGWACDVVGEVDQDVHQTFVSRPDCDSTGL